MRRDVGPGPNLCMSLPLKGLSEYSKMIQEIEGTLNTEELTPLNVLICAQDTYTFRLWGPAPFLDVLPWRHPVTVG